MQFTTLLLSSLAALATASSLYVDPKTSISFSAYINTATGYTFGIALPTTPSTDFIGLLTGKGSGWSGVSLGGSMLNKLLIVAWPNSGKIIGSFRETTKYGSPTSANGTWSLTPIPSGTYTNATHWSYTFLCKNCICNDGTTFGKSDTSSTLGWALNTAGPSTPASEDSGLTMHSSDGTYAFDLTAARSGLFANWSSVAGKRSVAGRVVLS